MKSASRAGADINFEEVVSHTLTIQVTDSGGATYSEDGCYSALSDIDEAPTDLALSNSSYLQKMLPMARWWGQ